MTAPLKRSSSPVPESNKTLKSDAARITIKFQPYVGDVIDVEVAPGETVRKLGKRLWEPLWQRSMAQSVFPATRYGYLMVDTSAGLVVVPKHVADPPEHDPFHPELNRRDRIFQEYGEKVIFSDWINGPGAPHRDAVFMMTCFRDHTNFHQYDVFYKIDYKDIHVSLALAAYENSLGWLLTFFFNNIVAHLRKIGPTPAVSVYATMRPSDSTAVYKIFQHRVEPEKGDDGRFPRLLEFVGRDLSPQWHDHPRFYLKLTE